MIKTSVLILFYNKNYEIQLMLEAFLKQTVDLSIFELVIIDDGSEVSIKNLVEEYQKKGLNITLKENPHTGNRSLNRNNAVELAKGENFIFYDSDMIPCANFIERHNKNLSKGKNIVSIGFRKLLNKFSHELLTPQVIKENFEFLEQMPCYLDERLTMIQVHDKIGLELEDAWYIVYGHDIGLSKTLFKSIKGFDEEFRFGWGGEDIDFAYQLSQVGAKICFDSEICCYHLYHEESTGKNEQYNRNLLYFFSKYKSVGPELFMNQHLYDTYTICSLYQIVRNGNHLSTIKDEEILKQKNTLFAGFKDVNQVINENGNTLISTKSEFADYKLVGSHLPYEDQVFDAVIVSENYSIFPTEYLFTILVEFSRVARSILFKTQKGLVDVHDFWKEITGYNIEEFINLKKIRIFMTPNSEARYNNVLYSELVKALNENGYYAELDIAYDICKDHSNIFPLMHSENSKMYQYYHRNVYSFGQPVVNIVDKLLAGSIKNGTDNLLWWGDVPYYCQNSNIIEADKKLYKKVMFRNDSNAQNFFRPGINATKINGYLSSSNLVNRQKGIVITDLFLENLDQIKTFVTKISSIPHLRSLPVNIICLNQLLEEPKIFKNSKIQLPAQMNTKQNIYINQYQTTYNDRITDLLCFCRQLDTVNIIHSNGSFEETDFTIKENSIYIDFNTKKEFNPYVIQAAAYGMQVYTSSDIYDCYKYPNIYKVKFELISALFNDGVYLDAKHCVRPEIVYSKRKMEVCELTKQIEKNKNVFVDVKKLYRLNESNSWKTILSDEKVISLLTPEVYPEQQNQ